MAVGGLRICDDLRRTIALPKIVKGFATDRGSSGSYPVLPGKLVHALFCAGAGAEGGTRSICGSI